MKKQTNKAFTLIELMIVVAIIGILAAVATPKFTELINKSRESTVKGALGAVRSAISIYYGDTEGVYPVNIFEALTISSKYMPPISGVRSLGKFSIPAVPSQGNPGHTTNLWQNATSAAAVLMSSVVSDGGTTPLYYNSGEGLVVINCSHLDMKQTSWSTY